MVETLNQLDHLRDSGFGRPWPRHGLHLLHWFANKCVFFDKHNIMLAECDPVNGDFGFHFFYNRCNGKELLDGKYSSYYVVGNLNFKKNPKAKNLPKYVLENKNTHERDSNIDRIIVSLNGKRFREVYVTQHYNQSNNYDPNATYRISRGLLMIIKRKSPEDFLVEMGYYTDTQPFINYNPQNSEAVCPDFTVISVSSSDSSDSEPPATQNRGTMVQFHNDTSEQNNSKNLPEPKGLWERFCTIL